MTLDPYSCDRVVPIEEEPRHHLVIKNELLRAFAVEIPPRGRTLCHRHGYDYMLYVAGESRIISAPQGGKPERHTYPDMHCECGRAGLVHVVENLANTPFRNIVVEVMPGMEGLRRGAPPHGVEGGSKSANLLNSEMLAACLVPLEAREAVTITGPAVVASPYEQPVRWVSAEKKDVSLSCFNDLRYLTPGQMATLRASGSSIARILVVALGRS